MIRANLRTEVLGSRVTGKADELVHLRVRYRAKCHSGLTDPQESSKEGQVMRLYPGPDLIGKQSTPQLELQAH